MVCGGVDIPARSANQRRRLFLGSCVFLAVLSGAANLPAFDIVPFAARNQSPLVQIFGLPSAGSAILLAPGRKELRLALDHASNYVEDSNARELITLDGETTRATLGGRYGLSGKVEVGMEIHYLTHSGGSLDGFLVDYHDAFGFPQGGRDTAPRNRLLYRYSRDGVEKLRMAGAADGLGDISLTAGFQLYHDPQPNHLSLALRASVKLPTGDSDTLLGSGSTDAAVWFSASEDFQIIRKPGRVYAAAGVMAMTEGDVLPDQQRRQVGFGTLGVGWNPLSWLGLKVQADFHTAFYNGSDLKSLSANAAQLLVGGTLAFSERIILDIAVSEDIATKTSPDAVFHFNLSTRF